MERFHRLDEVLDGRECDNLRTVALEKLGSSSVQSGDTVLAFLFHTLMSESGFTEDPEEEEDASWQNKLPYKLKYTFNSFPVWLSITNIATTILVHGTITSFIYPYVLHTTFF